MLYFLKCKSEFPAFVHLFAALLLNKMNINIRVLRTDNGGEFTGKPFEDPSLSFIWISILDFPLWRASIYYEYDSLIENRTWELCLLPAERKNVSSKLVFDLNVATFYNGVLPRCRTRLVVRGFIQEKGIDFDETFSPVASSAALRVVLSLVAVLDLEMY